MALFVEGKGAHFCGPYSIHSHLPEEVAKPVREYLAACPPTAHLFSTSHQVRLSRPHRGPAGPFVAVHTARRPSSSSPAAAPPTTSCSWSPAIDAGTRCCATLAGGVNSSEASRAAQQRAELVHRALTSKTAHASAGDPEDPIGAGAPHHPMWMGLTSGLNGSAGRRVRRIEPLFSLSPPSAADLGVATCPDTSAWPLHVKDVGVLDFDLLVGMVTHADLRDAVRAAQQWVTTDKHYGIDWPPLVPEQIPFSRFTDAQIVTMLEHGKLVPLPENTAIRCAVKGFATPQYAKERLRPVFEPLNNAAINRAELPPLKPPSRPGASHRRRRSEVPTFSSTSRRTSINFRSPAPSTTASFCAFDTLSCGKGNDIPCYA